MVLMLGVRQSTSEGSTSSIAMGSEFLRGFGFGAGRAARVVGLGRRGFGFGLGFGRGLAERCQLRWRDGELRKAAAQADQNGRENKDAGTVYVFGAGGMDQHLCGKFYLRGRST